MNSQGQLSLEYLIVLSAFLSVLLLFVPLISSTYHLGMFGLDARNAKAQTISIQQALNEFPLLSDGSSRTFSFDPLLEWRVSFTENNLHLTVHSEELDKKKTFSVIFSSTVVSSFKTISGETKLVLEKNPGFVSVKYLDP